MANQAPRPPPTLKRQQSSNLSIEDGDFLWLKQYFTRAEEPAPPPAILPVVGQKHKQDEMPLACLSPHRDASAEDDEEDTGGVKRRRKVGWTNTEDLTILAAVRRIGTQWQRIASQLPGRTADAVRNRWHRLQRTHALGDTEEGRSALDGLLIASGVDPHWCPPELSTQTESVATGTSTSVSEEVCIRGSDHGRQMWTPEEDQKIRDGVSRHGCKWRRIAADLPGRSDSSVRNRWMRLCRESQSAREESLREESVREEAAISDLPFGAQPAAAVAQAGATALAQAPPPARQQLTGSDTADSVAETLVAVPRQASASEDQLLDLDELSASLRESLGIEPRPLGLNESTMVVDLSAFMDAVSGCIEEEQLHFEAVDALQLRAAPSSRPAPPYPAVLRSGSIASAADDASSSSTRRLRLASAAIAVLAVVTVASTVMRHRRQR